MRCNYPRFNTITKLVSKYIIMRKTFLGALGFLLMSPQMHCQSCEQRIKGNIRFVKGTKKIDTSVDEQKVAIVYD